MAATGAERARAGTGVLLVQVGTPAAPTENALRSYLREFLSDRRVVDLPRWLWLPILYGPILMLRPRRSAALYRRIWTAEGSPLLVTTRRQAQLLDARLGAGLPVEIGMRYGEPSLRAGIARLRGRGARRLLIAPLFPQDSSATVGSVRDGIADALCNESAATAAKDGGGGSADAAVSLPWRVLAPFPDDPRFVGAVVARASALVTARGAPDHWLFSFHGLPQRYAQRGDVYPEHCARTARALAAALQLPADTWTLCYQSRFGPEPWLQPYTSEVLDQLARGGTRTVYVVCPGFLADCLETLDEIGTVAAGRFAAGGGGQLTLAPCLNDDPGWIAALAGLVLDALDAWSD